MRFLLAALLILCAAGTASAQMIQSGPITRGHPPVAIQGGLPGAAVFGDAGSALDGKLTELGITNTGTPFCINDAARTGPYHQMCFGANALGGGLLSYDAFGGAAQLPFSCEINGVFIPDCLAPGHGALSPCQLITAHGGSGDGITDNTAAWAATVAANSTSKVCVAFPPGNFKFLSPISVTLPSGTGGVTVQGAGPGATVLNWPNSGGGLAITLPSLNQSATISGLELTTGQTSGGTALSLTNSSTTGGRSLQPTSVIENVSIHGSDGYSITDYWTTAVKLIGMSNVNIISPNIAGAQVSAGPPRTFAAVGIDIEGSSASPSAQINVSGASISCVNRGLIYGNYVQGVTVSGGSNFVCGSIGIYVPSSSTNLDQLTVVGNSFNEDQFGIEMLGVVNGTLISDNIFIMGNGTLSNATGLHIGSNEQFSITHNNFQAGGPTSTGVNIDNGSGVISANTFQFITTGITLGASTGSIWVSEDNRFASGITTNINNLNTGNAIIGNTAWTPGLSATGTAGAPAYTTRIGNFMSLGSWWIANFQVSATGWAGPPSGDLLITGLPRVNSAGSSGSCSINYASGIVPGSGYVSVSGRILPSEDMIRFYEGPNNITGAMTAVPVSTVNPGILEIVGTCNYHP